MKTLKTSILSLGISIALLSCDSKEKAQLHHRLDSLNSELQASKKVEENMHEVAVLIDSIDASRRSLNTKMTEGTSYSDYISRLRDISTHIQETENKLTEMERSAKNSKRISDATIRRLRTDLALRSKEIVALQIEVATTRDLNHALSVSVNRKDSVISVKDQTIKVKEGDIASLQELAKDIDQQNKVKVADLYFAEAQALETAAHRTKFAPRRKKETRREALELYKLSLSLGKTEAQPRIDQLEKELS